MSGLRRGPGQPKKPLAQTVEEALSAVQNGTAPYRPRNYFEKLAMAKPMGAPQDLTAPVWQAAKLAKYLMETEGKTQAEAVRVASGVHKASPANIRKYLKKLRMPMVDVRPKGLASPFAPLMAPEVRPFCVVEDATPDTDAG